MVEVLVENAFLAAEVVLDGDAKCLDEVDDGLLLEEDPCLSLLNTIFLSRNIRHDIFEMRVRWVDATSLIIDWCPYLARGTTRCEQKSCCSG